MSKSRELSAVELEALELVEKRGATRGRLESGELQPDTLDGKLTDRYREEVIEMLRRGGFDPDQVDPKLIDDFVKEQIGSVSDRRERIRERNIQLIKDFSKGGRFEGRRLDPRVLFKDDEMEAVASEPGGIADAMAMKSSLPTALAYLAFLQQEGHETFAGVDYTKVVY